MLITKAWIAPARWHGVARNSPVRSSGPSVPCELSWLDLPVALWCALAGSGDGLRLRRATRVDRRQPLPGRLLAAALAAWPTLLRERRGTASPGEGPGALCALCAMPFSVLEGVLGHSVYGAFYEPHPFRFDGTERYLGYRPIGFFENGNQFGLWVALCALAAVWLARTEPTRSRRPWAGIAAVLVLISRRWPPQSPAHRTAGPSVRRGLAGEGRVQPRRAMASALLVLAVGGGVYLSARCRSLTSARRQRSAAASSTACAAWAAARSPGASRRIRNSSAMRSAPRSPAASSGTGGRPRRWRPGGPWGLPLLAIGQFGLTGFGLDALHPARTRRGRRLADLGADGPT